MSNLGYGMVMQLQGITVDEAVNKITDALQAEGFGILTEIDVKATLKKKLDIDFRQYRILGACNPVLAHQALEAEPQIGLLLPCNVVVQESDDGVTVSAIDPRVMFQVVENPGVEPLMADATQRLQRAMATLE